MLAVCCMTVAWRITGPWDSATNVLINAAMSYWRNVLSERFGRSVVRLRAALLPRTRYFGYSQRLVPQKSSLEIAQTASTMQFDVHATAGTDRGQLCTTHSDQIIDTYDRRLLFDHSMNGPGIGCMLSAVVIDECFQIMWYGMMTADFTRPDNGIRRDIYPVFWFGDGIAIGVCLLMLLVFVFQARYWKRTMECERSGLARIFITLIALGLTTGLFLDPPFMRSPGYLLPTFSASLKI